MGKIIAVITAISLLSLASLIQPAWAKDEVQDLKQQIEVLNQRILDLENQLREKEAGGLASPQSKFSQ